MRIPFITAVACCVLAAGFAPAANAATISKFANRNPAGGCTLSTPTINTGVRPKATGFRNEGTVNNFVICSFDIDTDIASFTSLIMYFASFDGAAHTFDCTAMDRSATSVTGDYVTKSVSVPASGLGGLSFGTSEFPTTNLGGWNVSVTCTLPPGVSIVTMGGYHNDNVGT